MRENGRGLPTDSGSLAAIGWWSYGDGRGDRFLGNKNKIK